MGDAEKHVNKVLYAFIRGLLEVPATSITIEIVSSATINCDVLAIIENIMYCYKSKRQVTDTQKYPEGPFQHRLEWPQLLVVSIAVHQSTRIKKLLESLLGFDLFVDYSQMLSLEKRLANPIIESTREEGVYFPATIRKSARMHSSSLQLILIKTRIMRRIPPPLTTATALFQRHESFTDPERMNTRKFRLHVQNPRDRPLPSLNAPECVPCYARNKQGFNGGVTTFASLRIKTICSYHVSILCKKHSMATFPHQMANSFPSDYIIPGVSADPDSTGTLSTSNSEIK